MSDLRQGFTLLELLVAILIFTLVIGTIYFTLTAGIQSFHRGEESMEIYQSVRVGLAHMGKDLRKAVSPESPWSNLAEDERRGRNDPMDDPLNYDGDEYLGPEPKENDIIFVGDSRQVKFVVQEVVPGGDPIFDLREIQYSVDGEEQLLIRVTTNSILQKRMMEWRSLHSENETEYRLNYANNVSFEEITEEIARNIADLELEYFDGKEWRDTWDSNQYVDEEAYYDYADDWGGSDQEQGDWQDEEEPERLGLPDAVRVSLQLSNREYVQLVTEIPSKDVDRLYSDSNETAFHQVRR